ncbi:MAG: alpha-ketoacid dehydrogenase subunit beta [Acidimicrobiales bacterium]
MKVLESLNRGLLRCLAADPSVVVMGEDILDPYGGAFKVTRGLSERFGDRVWTTPVSEAAMVGVATGMALRGSRPVVEIMFGDFTTLVVDQLVNHATKFAAMYGRTVTVPVVVRAPMGGRRGYGPTHSQTLEKLFLGVPGLRVLAAAPLGDPGELLAGAVLDDDGPVLFVENKLLYGLEIGCPDDLVAQEISGPPSPAWRLTLGGPGDHVDSGTVGSSGLSGGGRSTPAGWFPPPAVTLCAYGYGAHLAAEAVVRLAYEHELFCELVVVTQLAPWDPGPVNASVERTRRLVTVEEGTRAAGWGAEVLARAVEHLGPRMTAARRIAAADTVLPAASPLELEVLPGVDDIIKAALDVASVETMA